MEYAYESKYKRWAWGALIGLVVVIIVAAIVIAASLSSPKPKAEVATVNTGDTSEEERKAEEERQAEEERKAEEARQAEEARKAEGARQTEEARRAEEARQAEANRQAASATSIPKTGPEDMILPILALAVSGYLVAYNVALAKKNA